MRPKFVFQYIYHVHYYGGGTEPVAYKAASEQEANRLLNDYCDRTGAAYAELIDVIEI